MLSHDNADLSGADYVSPWDCCVSAVDSYVGLPGSMGYSTWDAVNILLGWTAISFDDDKDKNPGKKNNLSFNRGSTREQKRFLPGSFFFFFFVEGGGGGGYGPWPTSRYPDPDPDLTAGWYGKFIIWRNPRILRSDWLPEQARWDYLARSGFPAPVPQEKYSLFRRIINSLLTKFVRSRWLDTGLVLFYVFIDLNAEKELGQYTAISTWRLVSKAYVLCFEGRVFKKVFKEVQWIVLHKSKKEQGNSCRNLIVSAYERVVPCKSAFKGSKKR